MKRIIVGLMALVLVAAMIGGGTMAWFSDTAYNNTNEFTTGTLTVKASNDGSTFTSNTVTSTWSSPANWAPGSPAFTKTVWIRNDGTIDAKVVGTDWQYASGDWGLADYIEVKGLREWIPGYTNPLPGPENGTSWYNDLDNFDSVDTDNNDWISLKELITAYYGSDGTTSAPCTAPQVPDQFGKCVAHVTDSVVGGGIAPDNSQGGANISAIPAGQTFAMEMTFQLRPETPNAYQGKTLTVNVSHLAAQDVSALP